MKLTREEGFQSIPIKVKWNGKLQIRVPKMMDVERVTITWVAIAFINVLWEIYIILNHNNYRINLKERFSKCPNKNKMK